MAGDKYAVSGCSIELTLGIKWHMEQIKWVHVLGNTWCMELRVTIPVYFLTEQDVVFLDSGYAEDRPALEKMLKDRHLRVRAVLGSHSHKDHNGNHAWLQKAKKSEIILRDVEAAAVIDYALLTAVYGPATSAELKREIPELRLRADRTFTAADASINVAGAQFGLVSLPGHTPGHTGIVTPDGVLYVGDAVLNESILSDAKLPSSANWMQDIESKRSLLSAQYPKYILAHAGIYADITSLVEKNIADRQQRAAQIWAWLREREFWTQNEVEQLLWQKLELHSKSFLTRIVFRRNVRCVLEYLIQTKELTSDFLGGTEWYKAIRKKT